MSHRKIKVPNFNPPKHGECWECRKEYPGLVHPMFINGQYVPLCPRCALKVRNKIMGLPPSMPFQGEIAQDMLERQEDLYD